MDKLTVRLSQTDADEHHHDRQRDAQRQAALRYPFGSPQVGPDGSCGGP